MELPERIRFIRNRAHLSQAEFAEELGIDRSYISKLETGGILLSDQIMMKICLTFNINHWWLLEGKGSIERKWTPKEIKEFEREGFVPRRFNAIYVLYGWLLNELEGHIKIGECLGEDIYELEDPGVNPGDPIVVDIVRKILIRLEGEQHAQIKNKDRSIRNDINPLELSFLTILRTIDSHSAKDVYALLSSKLKRLPEKEREDLKAEIARIQEASE